MGAALAHPATPDVLGYLAAHFLTTPDIVALSATCTSVRKIITRGEDAARLGILVQVGTETSPNVMERCAVGWPHASYAYTATGPELGMQLQQIVTRISLPVRVRNGNMSMLRVESLRMHYSELVAWDTLLRTVVRASNYMHTLHLMGRATARLLPDDLPILTFPAVRRLTIRTTSSLSAAVPLGEKDTLVAMLACCPNVTQVCIHSWGTLQPACMRAIAACARLTDLELNISSDLTGPSAQGLAEIAIGCPRLTRLFIRSSLCRESLRVLTTSFPVLSEISLAPTGPEDLRMLGSMTTLADLRVSCDFTDEHARALCEGGAPLRALYARSVRTMGISDEGLHGLLNRFRFMHTIVIAGAQLALTAAIGRALGCAPGLRLLSLGSFDLADEAFVSELAKSKTLQTLRITGASNLTSRVPFLCLACIPSLVRLDLTGCALVVNCDTLDDFIDQDRSMLQLRYLHIPPFPLMRHRNTELTRKARHASHPLHISFVRIWL